MGRHRLGELDPIMVVVTAPAAAESSLPGSVACPIGPRPASAAALVVGEILLGEGGRRRRHGGGGAARTAANRRWDARRRGVEEAGRGREGSGRRSEDSAVVGGVNRRQCGCRRGRQL